MNVRQQEMIILFGTNGTGKTTVMLNAAVDYLIQNADYGKRVLCCIPDDSERKFDSIEEIMPDTESLHNFYGIKKLICEDLKVFTDLYQAYTTKGAAPYNGLMVFDDIGTILNRRPEQVLKFFKRRRQMNVDLFFNFHSLTTDMPRAFIGYATRIILFKTNDDHKDTMLKLPAGKRQEFEDMFFRVEEISKTNKFYYEELKLR